MLRMDDIKRIREDIDDKRQEIEFLEDDILHMEQEIEESEAIVSVAFAGELLARYDWTEEHATEAARLLEAYYDRSRAEPSKDKPMPRRIGEPLSRAVKEWDRINKDWARHEAAMSA